MSFSILFYTSLIICILGVVYRVFRWFSQNSDSQITTSQRILSAIKGALATIFSMKIVLLFKAFILDVLLQRRILKEDFLRWLMHILIFWGFILLLLMHALESIISQVIFDGYYSTVNPFLFLRNLFGISALIGIIIAIYRRIFIKPHLLKSNPADWFALFIIAAIMISGLLLEGAKISSYSEFDRMIVEYSELEDQDEIFNLEAYWVENYGLVSPNVKGPLDENILSQGREIHLDNCAQCHTSAKWAFAGFAVAKILKPVSPAIDRVSGVTILWYIHILSCFFGLIYMPFSKMFHIISTPVNLLINSVSSKEKTDPANLLTKQIIGLDACTHCSTCSTRCSAQMMFRTFENDYILPAEKLRALKRVFSGKSYEPENLQKGLCICTTCDRCTEVCPCGIDLRQMWVSAKQSVIEKGRPEPLLLTQFSFPGRLTGTDYSKHLDIALKQVTKNSEPLKVKEPLDLKKLKTSETEKFGILFDREAYKACFKCQGCTNTCPVVCNYENPADSLDLLPHQIMHSLGLGLVDMASCSKMIWSCLTCYLCQEHCPQNVEVCDILYSLKNLAVKRIT